MRVHACIKANRYCQIEHSQYDETVTIAGSAETKHKYCSMTFNTIKLLGSYALSLLNFFFLIKSNFSFTVLYHHQI